MKGKILFVVGLGVGYVLGTRAGRERYEQIRSAAEKVWNQPAVQQGVGTVKEFAAARVGDLGDTVLDGVKSFIGNATKSSGATKADVSRRDPLREAEHLQGGRRGEVRRRRRRDEARRRGRRCRRRRLEVGVEHVGDVLEVRGVARHLREVRLLTPGGEHACTDERRSFAVHPRR